MGLNANKPREGGNKVEQPDIEPGNYPARLVQILDLGLQAQRPYQGQEKAPVQEIMFTYELVDTFLVDEEGNELEDKPRWVSETLPFYGLHADKAKSTQRYNVFDPKGEFNGDISRAIGLPVNVTLVHNPGKDGKVYTNVGGISAMRPRDAQNCPDLKNPTKVFDLDAPDLEVFNKLPKWLQEKIQGNLNYNGSPLQAALAGAPKQKEEQKPAKPAKAAPAVQADEDDVPY